MDELEWKKVNNCFKDAQTYACRLPMPAREILKDFMKVGEVTVNDQFRRPSFTAIIGDIRIKGILSENIIKVSFSQETCQEEKLSFEKWLREIVEKELENK